MTVGDREPSELITHRAPIHTSDDLSFVPVHLFVGGTEEGRDGGKGCPTKDILKWRAKVKETEERALTVVLAFPT